MLVPRRRGLALIGLCLAGSSCHIGQRVLTVQVEVDGQVVLQGFRVVRYKRRFVRRPDKNPGDLLVLQALSAPVE